jgi:hypothetical protein
MSLRYMMILTQAAMASAMLLAAIGPSAQAAETAAQPEAGKSLPKVLLIGDSISMGYTPPVQRLLKGKADVRRVDDNCQSTNYGLQHIKEWLGSEHWDVIHFNWGIWDMHQMEGGNIVVGGQVRTPLPKYETNLRQLVGILKSTGAKLIWASITPLDPTREPEKYGINALNCKDVPLYNAAAAKVMAENGIVIDDLYSTALPRKDEIRIGDSIHYTEEGSRILAREVAVNIQRAINGLQRETNPAPSNTQ